MMLVCKVYRGMQQLEPGTNKIECWVRYTKTAPKNEKKMTITRRSPGIILHYDESKSETAD